MELPAWDRRDTETLPGELTGRENIDTSTRRKTVASDGRRSRGMLAADTPNPSPLLPYKAGRQFLSPSHLPAVTHRTNECDCVTNVCPGKTREGTVAMGQRLSSDPGKLTPDHMCMCESACVITCI